MALATNAYQKFLADPQREEVWLLELAPVNISTGATLNLYFSSRRYATAPADSLANQRFDPLIVRGLESSSNAQDIAVPISGLLPARQGGSIVLAQKRGNLDLGTLAQLGGVPLRNLSFGGRPATVRHGGFSPRLGRSLTYDEFRKAIVGTVDGQPGIATDDVEINLATKDQTLEYPLQSRTFWGLGYCLYFNGTTDYIDCGTSSVFNFTSGQFTVEFPIFIEANPASNRRIVSRGVVDTDGWEIYLSTAGRIVCKTNQAGASQETNSITITANRWVWVSVVRTGANVYIHLDGIISNNSSASHTDPLTASRNLYIGRNNSGTIFLNAAIGEVRIWNVARSAANVNKFMHRQLDTSEVTSSCVLYLDFDEGTGTALNDQSATNADGTITGADWAPSLTGDEGLSGVLPDCFGPVRGWSPILIDEVRQIYQVSAEQIQAFDRVDVGASANMTLETAETSFFTFITTTTASGKYDTLNMAGGAYLRLGSVPTDPLTVEVRGNAPGGTYLENAPDQARWIICNRGPQPLVDPTDLNTTSFTTLETANAAAVAHAWDSNVPVSEVIRWALASIGATGWFQVSTNLFTVKRFEGASGLTPSLTFTEEDVASGTLEALDRGSPCWNVLGKYRRNFTVMSSGDLLPGVAGTDRERFVKNEWRTVEWKNTSIRQLYKDAKTVTVMTGLDTWSAILAEVNRLGEIYDTVDQGFRFLCRQRGIELDRMDGVYFHYRDLDSRGDKQSRFGSSDTAKFVVLAVDPDTESGGVWLTIWREGVV